MSYAAVLTHEAQASLPLRIGLVLALLAAHLFVIHQLSQLRLPPVTPEQPEPVFVRFIELPKAESAPPEPVAAPPPPPEPRPMPKPKPKPAPAQAQPQPAPRPLPAPAPAPPVLEAPAPVEPALEPAPAPVPQPAAPAAPSAPPVAVAPPPSSPREVSALAYARKPQPEYPRLSRRLGEEGAVVIRVEVDQHGQARSARITRSSGFARLDEAALGAIRGAVFRPYLEDGRPVAAVGLVTIEFKLEN